MGSVANLLLLGAWAFAHHDALAWLAAHYVRDDRRIEALLLCGLCVVAWRRFGGPTPALRRVAHPPEPARAPLALLVAVLLVETLPIDLHLLRAALFVLGSYALFGLYARPATWRASLPWAGLLVATLPFGAFSEVYLGFPARLWTAEMVQRGLDAVGIASLSRDTILVLDRPGGPAAFGVDVPCAGVRSLWAAGVFLLAAAGLEGRRLDRWFGLAVVVTGVGILMANVLRVATLVAVGGLWGHPEWAARVHLPLGLFGFAVAVLAGQAVLRLGAPVPAPAPAPAPVPAPVSVPTPAPVSASAPAFFAPSPRMGRLRLPLVLTALVLATAAIPRASVPSPSLSLHFQAPAGWEPLAPVATEVSFFAEVGIDPPSKWRFESPPLSGSMLLLPTRSWRAHHLPEACLLARGRAVEGPWTVMLTPDFGVRVARVDGGAATGVWWFQSPGGTTEDLSVRTWAALSGREDRWVLATVLFDGDLAPSDPAPRAFLEALRAGVAASLEST